jgi:hypothetical protein
MAAAAPTAAVKTERRVNVVMESFLLDAMPSNVRVPAPPGPAERRTSAIIDEAEMNVHRLNDVFRE